MNSLRKLDLNQLVTLFELLKEKHVSRAAEALYKSQPAVSHTLNQLRELFQDPLLVRQNGQYQLTSKAESLYIPLGQILGKISDLVAQQSFQPRSCNRRFNIAMSDYGAAIITPKLVHFVRQNAPDVDLKIWHCSREEMQNKLQEGSLDLAFGIFNSLDYRLRSQVIFRDKIVSVADRKICTGANMDLVWWLSYPHILVSMKPYEANEIDHGLKLVNQQRRIGLSIPYWQIAPQLIENSDFILTIAQKALPNNFSENIVQFIPPLDLPILEFQMIWHERSDSDNALNWLRDTVKNILDMS